MGRGPATQYALGRELGELGSRLPVYRIDENGHVDPAGQLHLLTEDRYWLEAARGRSRLYSGLPPFLWDMKPQGYIGRGVPATYPELKLPPRIGDWRDDHCLVALARRGEDCVGNLLVGTESLDRYYSTSVRPAERGEYHALARGSLIQKVGSSAGGEHPKFAAFVNGRHVLVKFAEGEGTPAGDRWRDLLVCESLAARTIRAAGIETAQSEWLDVAGSRFLEVERFDRVGERGRRGTLSLLAIDREYHGVLDNWTNAAARLLTEKEPSLDGEDARRMRWLDAFGQLIGNTDRHFGNLSFFTDEAAPRTLRLAPVYDVLPMVLAPQGVSVVERPFEPRPPTAGDFDVWPDAARTALSYWAELAASADLSPGFRSLCESCRVAVESLISRVPGGRT